MTFDTVIATEEMTRNRIEAIASRYPYYVCEDEGRVVGYAYAHEWKGRGAYHNTLEASAYVLDGMTGRGIGRKLMECLIDAWLSPLASTRRRISAKWDISSDNSSTTATTSFCCDIYLWLR